MSALSLRTSWSERAPPWLTGHGLALATVGAASAAVLSLWLRRVLQGPWAPLHAELEILRILYRLGVARILTPSPEDGTDRLGFGERVRRAGELHALLALERNHQIDVARRKELGEDGWGETSGVGHMLHLPNLVFRGEDSEIARQALARSVRLQNAKEEALRLLKEWEQTPIVKDLVMVGGGHSHVLLLRMLGMEPLPGVRVTMVTRDVETPYSGMVPAHVAGCYTRRECHVDLNVLARFARVRLIHATATSIDVDKKQVFLSDGRPPISYDVLSINIGSAPRVQENSRAAGVTPVKPIDGFSARWDELLARIPTWKAGVRRRLLIVGGGAGGFELAMTMDVRLHKELARLGSTAQVQVGLVSRTGLLEQHSPGVRALATRELAARGVELLVGYEVTHADGGKLHCKDGRTLDFDDCIWCTQGAPQPWIATSGLATDADGFLLVDQRMRCKRIVPSAGDGEAVFAGGDIASVDGHPRPKAGVFAVMAGLVLWINIRATLRGEKLVEYWPQSSFLGLLCLGDGTCIASRGSFAGHGEWLWELKDWIDRRWMWNYSLDGGLPEMPGAEGLLGGSEAGRKIASAAGGGALALLKHATMRCGGCGAKVGATTLSQAMARVDVPSQPAAGSGAKVTVGVGDDAAVVELSAEDGSGKVAAVQTIDFFRSFVSDPFVFGRIAAAHALSDCEAMGAVPQTALALVQLPYAMEEKQEEDLVQLMSGAALALKEAGCALVGGHTCEAAEMGLGLSVNGRLPGGSANALTKGAMKEGDVLVLTKPIGTGALFAADMRAKACGPWIAAALRGMTTSNAPAAAVLRSHGAQACTDVTGFGLLGHLLEMCKGAKVQAAIDLPKVPLYDGALECVKRGITSSLQPANTRLRRAVVNHKEVCQNDAYPLLFDPQTSGGLLASVPKSKAAACVQALRTSGSAPGAAIVGEVLGPLSAVEVSEGSTAFIKVRVASVFC